MFYPKMQIPDRFSAIDAFLRIGPPKGQSFSDWNLLLAHSSKTVTGVTWKLSGADYRALLRTGVRRLFF